MKKNIWRPLQIAWLVLAMFVTHNSILALSSGAGYCAGSSCERDNDCMAPCICAMPTFTCYDVAQSER